MRIYNCGAKREESSHLDAEDCPVCGPGKTTPLRQPSISEVLEAVSEIVSRTFDKWWTDKEAEGAPNGFLGDVLHQIDAIKEKK